MPRWLSARAGAVGGGRELVRSARPFECSIHASMIDFQNRSQLR